LHYAIRMSLRIIFNFFWIAQFNFSQIKNFLQTFQLDILYMWFHNMYLLYGWIVAKSYKFEQQLFIIYCLEIPVEIDQWWQIKMTLDTEFMVKVFLLIITIILKQRWNNLLLLFKLALLYIFLMKYIWCLQHIKFLIKL
jgi:hypothetical protein